MVTTSSSTYWKPLKPRINIYDLDDTTYSTSRYIYDAFSTSGDDFKPIKLSFETAMTNVGQCSITIEDSDKDIDPDDFLDGQRVFIEGSKDGSTWQPAFKGVIRGGIQEAFGVNGRNFVINAYNYLIRHNERLVKVNKESSKTGSVYNKTDSTMFTDNLINDILTNSAHYIYAPTEAGISLSKTTNITASPVTTWIPKIDAEFSTLSSVIDEILEYSGAILATNFADDQLVLYDPDQVTSATGIFRVTNVVNKNADDVLNTMYPIEPYTYQTNYDTDESASRLILSYKDPDTAPKGTHNENSSDQINAADSGANGPWLYDFGKLWQAVYFQIRPSGDPGLIRVVCKTQGNCSGFASNSTRCWLYNDTNPPSASKPTIPISGPMVLYPRAADGSFPTGGVGYPSSPTNRLVLGMRDGDFCGELLSDETYWLAFESTAAQSNTNRIGLIMEVNGTVAHSYSGDGTTWSTGANERPVRLWNVPFKDQATPEINLDWVVTASDKAAQLKTGLIERAITSIPLHINGLQTIQEYLFPRMHIAAKPRIVFDYPSLTMPNKIPKAGDILCHADAIVDVGTETTPVQTTVIASARYDFDQDNQGVLGLTRLGLTTAGLKRGFY
jgi:hypothetical protein